MTRRSMKVPVLKNPNIVIRLAKNSVEVDQANQLVCNNYVDVGLWEDERVFWRSKFCHSPARATIVAVDGDKVIGTISLIKDSENGLPGDTFQPRVMERLRATGERLAEITALAVNKSATQQLTLVLFLYKFLYQYSFYYAGVDRLVTNATSKHASFYESVFCLQKLSAATDYHYVKLQVQFLALPLLAAHKYFSDRYEWDPNDKNNFYRFILVDQHPNLRFPEEGLMQRSRNIDWLARARVMDMPLAAVS